MWYLMGNDVNKSSVWDRVPLLQRIKSIKHIEIILLLIFVVVLALIYFSGSSNKNKTEDVTAEFSIKEYNLYLENKLASVINEISGVDNVSVMITLDGGIKYEYAKEKDEVTTSSNVSGGTNSKTTVSEKVVVVSVNGKNTPLVVKEIYPDVLGVIVVARGVNDVKTKLNIISAIETVLGVKSDNIQILQAS